MILTKTHILRSVAALWLCALVASCSNDVPVAEPGKPLPPGQYPLTFIASVDGMASRAAAHESWADGDEIGIRIGNYPKVGHYMLNADGTLMSAVEALDWQTTAPTTVTAWYPYVELDGTKTVEMDDQTGGLDPYDFLTATAENQIYTNTVKLSFKHQMSKISCKLVKGEGISDEEFQTVKVNFAGFTKASFSNGVLEGSYKDGNENNKWITPIYDEDLVDYEALVVPQDMSGKDFIKIDIKVNHNGTVIDKTLIYQPNDATADLKAGTHYSYSVIVQKDRLEVQSLSAKWEDNGKWHPAEPAVFQVNLPENVTLPEDMIYSENVKKEGNYLLVKGNRFTISYEVTDDNITKVFQISKKTGDPDRDIVTRTLTKNADDKFIYYFNYYLLSEKVDLEYVDFVQVGDYYYSNGTWGPLELKGDKTPIGIVFKVGAGGSGDFEDKEANYGWTEKKINGYAVALNDATDEKIKWGVSGKFGTQYNSNDKARKESPYTGYNLSMDLIESGKDYAAVKAAREYEPNAPGGSSGWYLPSIQQLIDIQNLPDRASLFTDVDGKDVKSGTSNDKLYYWSCLERTSGNANCFLFDVDGISSIAKTSAAGYVRAVLTF